MLTSCGALTPHLLREISFDRALRLHFPLHLCIERQLGAPLALGNEPVGDRLLVAFDRLGSGGQGAVMGEQVIGSHHSLLSIRQDVCQEQRTEKCASVRVMDFGQDWAQDLPEAARKEDLTVLSGRLRAALILAGKDPDAQTLLSLLKAEFPKLGRQTVHSWFQPNRHFIEPQYLFAISEVLNVSARWISTGKPPITRPAYLDDDIERLKAIWASMPSDEARQKWVEDGEDILRLLKATSKAAPFPTAN